MLLKKTLFAATTAVLATLAAGVAHAAPEKPECIAPAKPGGGFDLTCKLVQSALQNGYLEAPMRVTYMPGGIGAVAYNTVIANRPAEAGTVVAVPGTSEHQLGLAVDLVDANMQDLTSAQESTETQKWLMANSWRYGFIHRYPNGKTDITGIIYEPWHYRYVGKDAAQEIFNRDITLEEYLGKTEH